MLHTHAKNTGGLDPLLRRAPVARSSVGILSRPKLVLGKTPQADARALGRMVLAMPPDSDTERHKTDLCDL